MGDFKITRRSLDALKPKDGSEHGTRLADSDLPGFFVTVYATGRVAFAVRYRVHGQRRTAKLGDYPSTTPEDARKAALAVLGGAAKGEDEAAKRKAARREADAKANRITFGAWRETYIADADRRLKSTRDPERYLAMAGEEWDRRPLAEITTRDVETLRNRIAERGAVQANRWLANVRASLSHAVRLGYLDGNPAARVPLLPDATPRSRTLGAEEEKRLRAAVKAETDPFIRAAFTLLLDTGARLSEVLAAKWDDFDLEAGTWRIPSPKAGKPQAQPLEPQTVAVLEATPRLNGPFLVPGRNALVHRFDLRKPWDALKTAAKIGPDVHVHDLRRTRGLHWVRTIGLYKASKLLRHTDERVTGKHYAPLAPEDLRAFAEEARVLSFPEKTAAKK